MDLVLLKIDQGKTDENRDTFWRKKTPQGIFIRAYMSNEVRDR